MEDQLKEHKEIMETVNSLCVQVFAALKELKDLENSAETLTQKIHQHIFACQGQSPTVKYLYYSADINHE